MNRDYATGEEHGVTFFVGVEIEKTPAYGMKTLFVTGIQGFDEITEYATQNDCKHIFFGANHSFKPANTDEWEQWEGMIRYFLEQGYWCSLDIHVNEAEELLEGGLNEHNQFIPQIRVPLPYIKLWNYNAMVKLDDADFNHSNPGVWTHRLHDLMDRDKFTDWSQYKNDQIVK